ncbi:MAG: citrate lyase ACP [Planctomycetes bacterium]|jgi:citrate lyase subunit beta/citryl-CoA lyase|nr:citrate lyase ACP [Planctomycetota bacterium]MDP6410065.1 aldolase/citrate lyase family protein [Planctomycetota bacterium]
MSDTATTETGERRAAEAGPRGERVRSDCWIGLTPELSGGVVLEVSSTVESTYGRSIRALCEQGARALGIEHARIRVEDGGALPFVLMARLEAAARRALGGLEARWLPECAQACREPARRERRRRSRLYLPGDQPKYMTNAGLHVPDAVILDLEDSVPPGAKDTARILVRNALRQVDFRGAERTVRINPGSLGLTDIDELADENVHLILIPKVESAEEVRAVDARLRERTESAVYLMPIIESSRGVMCASEIAAACERVVAVTIGLEDYTADVGVPRTEEGRESLWARSMIVNAARAAGVQAIDSVFSDVADTVGLRRSVLEAKALGFEGAGCIHPRQVRVVHEAFDPTPEEVLRARQIVCAFREASEHGLAVVSLGSKMIDPPVVERALKTVAQAVESGLLAADWEESGD